ncbi:hypothetical protein C9374_001682 [Naegleria lovaniensis]|uniref:Uncharacterized protein n=1 Tax=Naegleria lovaniensis TaxID=51637 RepID=A0AA88GR50_NAELO|nr:uncharacterized protein C9374_001682 [Naegleria lovaniensis]KAG2387350.1 hypothetical protein C9374_001682 [Naegleria lovaniensis]
MMLNCRGFTSITRRRFHAAAVKTSEIIGPTICNLKRTYHTSLRFTSSALSDKGDNHDMNRFPSSSQIQENNDAQNNINNNQESSLEEDIRKLEDKLKSLPHLFVEKLTGNPLSLQQWNERLRIGAETIKKRQELRKAKGRGHLYLFYFLVLFLPTYLILEFHIWLQAKLLERNEKKLERAMQNEASYSLFNLSLYADKPPRDVRETRALNREKFYSNRELARLNFERISYQDKLETLRQFEQQKSAR